MTNAMLLEGVVCRGDEEAYEAVLHRYGPMVWRVCREILHNPHDAEDAFQATFLVLVRSAGAIRNRDALGRWLYETAYRIALRAKYQAARRKTGGPLDVDGIPARPEEDPLTRDLRPTIHDEVNRLPDKLRSAIVLCYFEGLNQDEASRRLRCPVRTLKGRLARGRELLRSRLARRGVTASALLLLMLLDDSCWAMSHGLVESTRLAMDVTRAHGSLPETITPRVARLVRLQAKATQARWMVRLLVPALVLVILGSTGANAMLTSPWEIFSSASWRNADLHASGQCGTPASPSPEPVSRRP